MNPDIKTQWVAALRSGNYEQGRRYLRWGEGFCCLGVLCDLAAKAGAASWEPPGLSNSCEIVQACGGAVSVLPYAVKRWAGLQDADPSVTVDGVEEITLSRANDVLLLEFPAIADLIEAQL